MSLRLRLLIATALAMLVGLVVVDVVTYVMVSQSQIQQVDASLRRARQPLETIATSSRINDRKSIPQIAPGLFVAIIDSNGNPEYVAAARDPGGDDDTIDIAATDLRVGSRSVPGSDDEMRLSVRPLPNGSTLVIGETLHEVNETRRRLLTVLIGGSVFAITVASALAWWLLRAGLQPLRRVESSAAAITDLDLEGSRVPGAGERTEVGRLATTLNDMLDRLKNARAEREESLIRLTESESRMRRFVADASHELRTPIAATAAYAELFEHGARDHPDDLERAMTGIRGETQRMGALVDDLLLLARLDEKRPIVTEEVDLTEVVLGAIDAARTVDPGRPLRPHIHGVHKVRGDQMQLRQVVDNLLANVRSHTPSDTACDVSLTADDRHVELTVADTGPGVEDRHLPNLFDRFYRVDDARTRESGGSGLGLSIVHALIESQHGTITASANEPTGLVVTVRLPVA